MNIEPVLKIRKTEVENSLSQWEKLCLRLFGHVQVGTEFHDGWKAPLPTYAFRCEIHGVQVSRAYGYSELLLCPECEEDEKKVMK